MATPRKIAVVTALFGNKKRDSLPEPTEMFPGHEFVCFSDAPIKSNAWDVRVIQMDRPPRVAARMFKTRVHRYVDAEFVVWTDASMRVSAPLDDLVDMLSTEGAGFASCRHDDRDCVFEESDFCQRHLFAENLRSENKESLLRQSDRYREEGHPEHWSLFATALLVRRTTPGVVDFGEEWWREIEAGTNRDQISFPFLLRKLGMKCATIPGSMYNNRFTQWIGHNKNC